MHSLISKAGVLMAALTIRNIDEAIKQSLRIRAAKHGVSMEEEARRILRHALQQASSQQSLGQRLKQRFAEVADADFELPSRQVSRTPPDWS
jgi:plasmid stability protein